MTAPATERDPFDARVARTATGLLAEFNEAEVLAPADVHVARRLARLGGRGADGGGHGEPEPVLLAAALAVRAIRNGSVCVDLTEVSRTVLGEGEQAVDVSGLPWPDPTSWRAQCVASPLVGLGADAPPGRPLRLVGDLLYLDRYWAEEEQVRREFTARAGLGPPVDTDRMRAALDRLFPEPETAAQRLAAAVAALRPVSVVAGGPGTGKTTTVARLLAVLHDLHDASAAPAGLRVALAAPTGKAAARLTETVALRARDLPDADRERVGSPKASTIHRLLGWRRGSSRFRHDRTNRLPHDVVVVDETSMVSLTLMARLLEAVRPDARLVLVGDPDQLASVEAGAVLGDLAEAAGSPEPELAERLRATGAFVPAAGSGTGPRIVHGVVRLDRNWRFTGSIAAFAAAVQRGDADEAVRLLRAGAPDLFFVETDPATADPPGLEGLRADVVTAGRDLVGAAREGVSEQVLRLLDRHRLLCGHRRGPYGVSRWSAEIERWLREAVPGYDDEAPWFPGRPLLVTVNDYDLSLFNGDTGVVVSTPDGPRAVFARDNVPTAFVPTRLGAVSTVHAMTVHRSQGSQFRKVTVVLPPADSPLMTRELLYTAVTRAEQAVRVVGTEDAVRAAVGRKVGRASGLRGRLGGGRGEAGVERTERT